MNFRLPAIAAAAILIASCVADYKQPPASSPAATVVFKVANTTPLVQAADTLPEPPGLGVYKEYGLVEGIACETYQRAALFNFNGGTQNRRVAVGAKAYIVGLISRTRSEGAPGSFSMSRCFSLLEFTPVAGHTYAVAVDESGRGCAAYAEDTATGNPPDDLTIHDNFPCHYFTR